MKKSDTQSIKAERYKKLESKPAWRAIKLILIASIVLISSLSTIGLWSMVNDCYVRKEAHNRWTPDDAGSFYRGAQPRDCDTQAAMETGFIVTALIPVAGVLIYKSFRYTAAYIAYGSEKK